MVTTPSGAKVDYTYTQAGVHAFIASAGVLSGDDLARCDGGHTKELEHERINQ